MSGKQKKNGATDFVSEIKRVENYPDFEKLAHVIQRFLVIEKTKYRTETNRGLKLNETILYTDKIKNVM